MNVRYRITLSSEERAQLQSLVQGGKGSVRRIKRAQILLAATNRSSDDQIALNVSVGTSTVFRTKRRFVEEGLEEALREAPRPGARRKLAAVEEALLVATACSKPPAGRAHWTMSLLADEMVRLTDHRSLSSETVRRRLAEKELKPWQEKMWCIPKVDAEFVARMEDVLQLYAEAPDDRRPVVCFDETPRQLIGEARVPVAAKPGRPARVDYEYVRNGTANVFMFLDVHRPWRRAKVTDRRTSRDFAQCMRELVDQDYPKAECIRVVMDNLSTHTPAALYETFEPTEARRILNRLEFLHAQARQLAEHGRDRDRRHGGAMPGPSHPREGAPGVRGRGLAATTKPREGPHQMALQRDARSREARPSLSRHRRTRIRTSRRVKPVRSSVVRY